MATRVYSTRFFAEAALSGATVPFTCGPGQVCDVRQVLATYGTGTASIAVQLTLVPAGGGGIRLWSQVLTPTAPDAQFSGRVIFNEGDSIIVAVLGSANADIYCGGYVFLDA